MESWMATLVLAFQSMGVIYGDIGTSPMYVFDASFSRGHIRHSDDILGVLSLIIYTMLFIPMIKYVFITLKANHKGDGGTLALYSLICRYARVSYIPNNDPHSDESNMRRSSIKHIMESSKAAKLALFLSTILGTSMVIGDGVLTPCVSVSGINHLNQDEVVYVSIAVLIFLFCIQRFGTDKLGCTFAPVIFIWLLLLSGIGIFNLVQHDSGVLRAFNPIYIVNYFRRNGKQGWISLGGVVLCITGAEAMFADLGHFNVPAVQISFSAIVFPALLLAYTGQAAYLTKYPDDIGSTFYKSIPHRLYLPTIVVANAAAVIASQALITGVFSIVSQSSKMRCFPRVRVVHTSPKHAGQVYIPEVNYLLMAACVCVTYWFKTPEKIGHAYGIAVVAVMLITTCLVTLIMLLVWRTRTWVASSFFVFFMSIELAFFSSVLYKFFQGGYLPLALSIVLMAMMGVWHYVHIQRSEFELRNKVPDTYVTNLAENENRIPGIGLLFSELVEGVPLTFPRLVSSIHSIYSVFVFVSIESVPVSKVAVKERFSFRQVEPRGFRMFRCAVRYGYKDPIEEPDVFKRQLVENLKEFIRHENLIMVEEKIMDDDNHNSSPAPRKSSGSEELQEITESRVSDAGSERIGRVFAAGACVEEEIGFLERAEEEGVVFCVGEAEVVARGDSSWLKKLVINDTYSFLRKMSREDERMVATPRTGLVKVVIPYDL